MKTFDDTGAWNLPVVDNERYVGFVSKSKIFNSYPPRAATLFRGLTVDRPFFISVYPI